MSRRQRILAVLFAATCLVTGPTFADADKRVTVSLAGGEAERELFERLVRELLGRLDVQLVVDGGEQPSAEPAGTVTLVIRVDMTDPEQVKIRVRNRAGAEIERTVALESSRAVVIDESAHVVQSLVESLLAEEEPPRPEPVARAVTPKIEPEPPRTRAAPAHDPPPPAYGIDAAALVGLHGVADGAGAVPGAGVGVNAAYRRGTLRPGAWLIAEYRFPFDLDQSSFPSRAQTYSLRLVPAIDALRGGQLALQAGIGGGFDRFEVEFALEDPKGHQHRSSGRRLAPVLTALLALRVGLVQNVQLTALLGVDLDPDSPDLEMRMGHAERSSPWSVRPGLLIGISFTPVGREPIP